MVCSAVALGCLLPILHAPAAPKKSVVKRPAAKTVAQKPKAPQISSTDPNRWMKVKAWEGTFVVTSQESGEKQEGVGHQKWSSSTRVEGTFRVDYHHDPRDGDRFSWKGKGEARVQIEAVKDTTFPKLTPIHQTYKGDYRDVLTATLFDFNAERGIVKLSLRLPTWQEQPHQGKAIDHVYDEGRIHREEKVNGYNWAADAGAGFAAPMKLPKTGFTLSGTHTNTTQSITASNGVVWHSSWTIKPVGEGFDEPLKAVAGGPYKIERGQTLALDGSRSTGKIKNYKWTFAPANVKGGAAAIPFSGQGAKEGARPSTVLLSPVKVTLTVSDGKATDTDSAVINVTPRTFKTLFTHRDEEKLHPNSTPPRMIKGRNLQYAGGENVCALDEYAAKNSVHILHPANVGGTWEGSGYALTQVKDAGGPFDGTWFLSSYGLRVERQSLVNKYILPGGPPPVRTAKPFYESNKKLGNDVDGYLAAVRKHEMLHSELMQKGLAANDPGPKIESWVGGDKDALQKRVDETIQKSEDAIDKVSADPLPQRFWKGKIAFPDDATDTYVSIDMEI